MKKRLISLLLAFSMMLTFLPAGAVSAFAEGTADDTSMGTILENGASITTGGVYRLHGEYTKAIEINTSESVTINIAAGDEVTFKPDMDARTNVLLDVVTNSDLTVDNNGVYNGPTFLYTGTKSDSAKVTIHGGRYNITKQPNVMTCAFAFNAGGSDENPIVVDGVHIEAGADCTGIDAGGHLTAPKVKIINSEINVLGTGYTAGGAINIKNSQTSVILENVTAHATKSATIMIGGGNLTIKSGHYTNDGSPVVSIYDDWAADVPTVKINGGTFIGSDSESSTLMVSKTSGTMEIHGGTFTSTKCGQVLGNQAQVTIDSTVSVPEFNSEGGTADAIVNVGVGKMQFDDGIITVSGGSDRAALRADGTTYNNTSKTEINGGKIIGAKYGIRVRNGKPNVILRGVQFENNDTDIYLNANQKITIEETFNHNATVACADPKDGRQLTTSTAGTDYYQKNLNLTSANKGYLVDYKKTTDGQEYRCLSKTVGVTISNLKGEIKAEESAEFTVTLDHEGSTGTGILTFGDKNSEIEYKDENDKYQLMPKDGLPIDLASNKNDYTFRITPKNAGEQKLTAAVVRDAVKLGTAEEGFTVTGRVHTAVTIEGLEDAVIKEGESKDFTVKVDPKDDAKLGEAFIDFGDKNSEIEYKDENGEYKPMPEGGLPIDLSDVKEQYAFRIAPKETGKQTLTAAVVRDTVELGTDSKDYTVAGRVHTTVTIEGLKDAVIKEGESKDFTVKVDPKDDTGKGKIDFGGKNGEVQYKDGDDWKDMPADGLEIDLNDGAKDYEFRITPKMSGEQTLTVTVTKENGDELGKAEAKYTVNKKDVFHTLTVIGGTVKVDGTAVAPDADNSYPVKEDAVVEVSFDRSILSDAQTFDQWTISDKSLLGDPDVAYDEETFTFTMPHADVKIESMTRDASIDEGPNLLEKGAAAGTVIVGGVVLLYQGHMLGTELYLRYLLPHGAIIPQNRAELAVLLWQDAGNPEPVSTALYSDISNEDSAIQQAARWAVENDLMELLDADEHPDHFDPFAPVTFTDSIHAWKKAQERKQTPTT